MDLTTLAVAGMSLIGTLAGTFGGILVSNKLTTYRIEQLEQKVAAHNSLVERTYKLEGQMTEVQHDIRDLKSGDPDMSSTVILAAAAAFALGCVFCLGLWWLSAHRSRRGRMETMKAAVWLCLFNGCAWVWCSYLLAYLGREQIAEQLSGKAVTEIIAVILAYAIKSILENLSKHNNWPDRSGKKEETTHE